MRCWRPCSQELLAYPAPGCDASRRILPRSWCRCGCARKSGELSFLSTTTVFGTPLEVTLSELAIESFFPADAKTARVLRTMSMVGRVLRFPFSLREKKTHNVG